MATRYLNRRVSKKESEDTYKLKWNIKRIQKHYVQNRYAYEVGKHELTKDMIRVLGYLGIEYSLKLKVHQLGTRDLVNILIIFKP